MTNNDLKPMTVIDGHVDYATDILIRRDLGERNVFDTRHANILRQAGVKLQVAAIYIQAQDKPHLVVDLCIRQMEALLEDIEESTNFILIKDKKDLEQLFNSEKIGILIDLEGAEVFEHGMGFFHLFHRLGMRMLGLTWNQRNGLASGIDDIGSGSGLTSFGKDVVEEAFRTGVIPDVSHLSPRGVDDILSLAKGPIVASHAGVKSVFDCSRNLSDEHVKGIASTGGVIGIPAFPTLIASENASVDTVVDHIERVVELVGEDFIGVGTDFVNIFHDLIAKGLMGKEWVPPSGKKTEGFEGCQDFPNLVRALARRGFSSNQISKIMGLNFLRVFEGSLR
ncbi:MAG: membrane dipeptidase [Deltaproteobacteria bacterium]|nr:membrane dipeptidase [Deltaproteobacteria bacterium]